MTLVDCIHCGELIAEYDAHGQDLELLPLAGHDDPCPDSDDGRHQPDRWAIASADRDAEDEAYEVASYRRRHSGQHFSITGTVRAWGL